MFSSMLTFLLEDVVVDSKRRRGERESEAEDGNREEG